MAKVTDVGVNEIKQRMEEDRIEAAKWKEDMEQKLAEKEERIASLEVKESIQEDYQEVRMEYQLKVLKQEIRRSLQINI